MVARRDMEYGLLVARVLVSPGAGQAKLVIGFVLVVVSLQSQDKGDSLM